MSSVKHEDAGEVAGVGDEGVNQGDRFAVILDNYVARLGLCLVLSPGLDLKQGDTSLEFKRGRFGV